MNKVEITGLWIYPVKSMRGIEVSEALLTAEGFEHDRRFMVVHADGRFATQRDLPPLALIRTGIENGSVILSRPGFGEITIPAENLQGDIIHTKVWGDHCETVDQGEELSRWLQSALQCDERLRLVGMRAGFRRPQNKPELLGENTSTCFADAAPFLVANESSLDTLNQNLTAAGHETVPMNRFRPNIVVRGLDAFAEHRLSHLEGGEAKLSFCHPCERCVVTTIDQETAEKHPGWQPFKTLRDINPMPGKKPAPAFGHNAVLSMGEHSTLRTGDQLTGHYS